MTPITSSDDIKSLGTIMGVWAHPDDEVMSMCGILCAAVKNGQTVACVTATRGEAGVQDESRWPAKKLGHIREQELKAAYRLIGISQHHFLDYPDGECKQVHESEAVQRLVSLIETYQPDVIMTFGPDGMTGHPDHQAVSKWVSLANAKASKPAKIYHSILTNDQYSAMEDADKKFNFFFNIDQPKTCDANECAIKFELTDQLFDCKMKCLSAMPSQYEAVMKEFGDKLRPSLGMEAFIESD